MAKTVAELERDERDMVMVSDIAQIIGFAVDRVRDLALDKKFDFPVITYGNEVRIPRIPFIKYMRGEEDMELITYIELTKTVSFLRGAASTDLDEWPKKMCKKAADSIEAAINADLPWELRNGQLK